MIEAIVRLSIERRYLILSMILVLLGVGFWSYQRLPIDAVPDITNVQVQINTQAPGYSPLEAEQRVTYPIETVMAGLPNLEQTRSDDRGPGVPPDQRERIFEPFYRMPGASERDGGVGLGLALVRSIAERHGGRVDCDNRAGGGARFTLRLPAQA